MSLLRHLRAVAPASRSIRRRSLHTTAQLRYLRALRAMIARIRDRIDTRLLPVLKRDAGHRTDDAKPHDPVRGIIATIAGQLDELTDFPAFVDLLDSLASGVASTQAAELAAALGISLDALTLTTGESVRAVAQDWVAGNVTLIKSVATDYLDQVADVVEAAYASGTRYEDIVEELASRFGVAESRAELIARDQIAKVNARVNQERQEDLGITGYIWRTSQDDRVRPEHEEREGEPFSWSDPPEDGHPGSAVNCRCWSEAQLPEDLQ